ncbi:MAG: hypothetical protein Q8N62_02905 [Candidatus Omnitrophota bacterium]|nr:hypothetical protein [Candidatus Omnitrophota bacterium]
MRKEISCLAIVTLLVLGLSGQGFCMARRPPDPKKSTPKQAESIQKVSGMISGYDWTRSTITVVPTNGALITAEIDKTSKISKAGKLIKMADIKTGDVVSVAYETKGWKKIARKIIVQEKVAAKAATTEKKKK